MKKIKNFLINVPHFYYDVFVSIYWLTTLSKTDSYFIVYILIAFYFLFFVKNEHSVNKREKILIIVFSFLISFFITAANYNIADNILVYRIYVLFTLFISTFYIIYKTTVIAYKQICKIDIFNNEKELKNIFIKTFLFISIIDILILFVCNYPGVLTSDSIGQIQQIETGIYSNHHPYWHTCIIKVFYNLGKRLFNNSNAGVATYSIFQIITMALIVSYANKTLCQIHVNKIFNILLPISFVVLPYHLYFSFTVWKDVLFGGSVLLFIVSSYRIFNKIGNTLIDYSLFIISCFGFCLLRSNGWYAFLLITFVTIFLFSKNNVKIPILVVLVLLSTYYLQNNYIESKDIAKPDIAEHLSIPAQQIARVVVDCDDLSKEQSDLLNNVIEVNKIKENYNPIISDNIKNLIRKKDNSLFIADNKSKFINLYINLGLKHPLEYLKAWIDQIKGFINSGYQGETWANFIESNPYSIKVKPLSSLAHNALFAYSYLFFGLQFTRLFISVGLHVWLIMFIMMLGLIFKNKIIQFYSLTLILIVGTLLIATPLHSSIRYAYAIFTCIFFLIIVTLKEIHNND